MPPAPAAAAADASLRASGQAGVPDVHDNLQAAADLAPAAGDVDPLVGRQGWALPRAATDEDPVHVLLPEQRGLCGDAIKRDLPRVIKGRERCRDEPQPTHARLGPLHLDSSFRAAAPTRPDTHHP